MLCWKTALKMPTFENSEKKNEIQPFDSKHISYTIKDNPLTLCSMFSEQTAPIGTYDIPIDSELHADGCMKPKNGPRALTGYSLVYNNIKQPVFSNFVPKLLPGLWTEEPKHFDMFWAEVCRVRCTNPFFDISNCSGKNPEKLICNTLKTTTDGGTK